MDHNDPDLGTSKSNPSQNNWARELEECCFSAQSTPKRFRPSVSWSLQKADQLIVETYEDEVLATLEEQYLQMFLFLWQCDPILHMAMFRDSTAESNRNVLNLLIWGYVHSKSVSWVHWRKCIFATFFGLEGDTASYRLLQGSPFEMHIDDTQENSLKLSSHQKIDLKDITGFFQDIKIQKLWSTWLGRPLMLELLDANQVEANPPHALPPQSPHALESSQNLLSSLTNSFFHIFKFFSSCHCALTIAIQWHPLNINRHGP